LVRLNRELYTLSFSDKPIFLVYSFRKGAILARPGSRIGIVSIFPRRLYYSERSFSSNRIRHRFLRGFFKQRKNTLIDLPTFGADRLLGLSGSKKPERSFKPPAGFNASD